MNNLYETISKQVKNSSISYSILKIDNSIEIEDLIQDVYLKMYDKNKDYVYSRIKQHLIDIYRKKSKKVETCTINDEILSNEFYVDRSIINEGFEYLKKIDNTVYICTYSYHINNMTYKEISERYSIPLNTVKRKVDKGVELLREYYKH